MQIVSQKLARWLLRDIYPPRKNALSDFSRIVDEIHRCDILLIEGRSRVSRVIGMVTQSIWTHSAIYLGRLYDIKSADIREKIADHYQGPPDEPLILESLLGKGVIISPLTNYQHDHIRICRPRGLLVHDADKVIEYAVERLGVAYNARQVFDLGRFLLPWGMFPRRWRSSLFAHNAGGPTQLSCSQLLAEAFEFVDFPILPVVVPNEETGVEFIRRNARLYTPSDFDYSPFFQIVKYPMVELGAQPLYRHFPWNTHGLISNDQGNFATIPLTEGEQSNEEKP